ncbi:hypothetical protein Ddye_025747 [Dipteronia dyeriana]|uniref:Reverse transcriptase n=1 Tax=Dipteronia dyeriana TaxID=168575 RepID=A0AAD9WPQ9_9ROSI|nr:hypothetical protein Ddye_025747 [Dipteronia dyeriana]
MPWVLNDGHPLDNINGTLVALIPKTKRATRVFDFRSISLCNVVYKIVAKTIANRLKVVLGDVISESQSALIPGRLILVGVIVGFECMHALQMRKKGERLGLWL